METPGYLRVGKCTYDVEDSCWIHGSDRDCQHGRDFDGAPPCSREQLVAIQKELDELKQASEVATQEINKIVEDMLKTGDQVRDISQYAKYYRYLRLFHFRIGLGAGEGRVILCTTEYLVSLIAKGLEYNFRQLQFPY